MSPAGLKNPFRNGHVTSFKKLVGCIGGGVTRIAVMEDHIVTVKVRQNCLTAEYELGMDGQTSPPFVKIARKLHTVK
jgi:hypothetical protein